MPQFSSTFIPGGHDDYHMPEMYAPSPQRVMPEVPQNMQQDLQRMELEAGQIPPRQNYGSAPNYLGDAGHARGESLSNALSDYTTPDKEFRPWENGQKDYNSMADYEAPGDSPFPRIKGENIPPSDKEKEEILYNARTHVLHSNNVNMQLTWARDSLNYVEIAADVRGRDNRNNYGARPQTPAMEHDLKIDAMSIVKFLVDQGHPEAIFMKAKWEEFGKFGERQDKKAAFIRYRAAAEQGWARAEYRMGMLYENSNDVDKAIQHYYNGEQVGDSAAMYRLGMMSLLGQHGQRQDYHRGIDLINRAADTADEDAPQGAYVYGMLIARDLPDIVVPEDLLPYKVDTARQYIEKAAYLGFAKAQLKMGQAYELCQLGCDFNPSYSLHYYGLASAQGQPEAALGVSRWFLFGYEGTFAKNEALAFKYAKQAADSKLATGEFAMGYYHEIGIHVPKDLNEARRWYDLAASHGNQDAVGRLDSLSRNKSLSKKDHETTALTRIKSQHGSMRGKRPERLQRMKEQQHMASLPESGPGTPNNYDGRSPRASPNPSPRHGPNGAEGRPPAFGLNVAGGPGLAMRPKSAAPYPDDEPQPLNVNRPKSAAPYPDEGPMGPPQAQRPYSGLPPPTRPSDPYGPRPGSAGGRLGAGPNLGPGGILPAGTMPGQGRGRVPSANQPYPPGSGPSSPYPPGGPRQGSMSGPSYGGPKPSPGPAGNGMRVLAISNLYSNETLPMKKRLTKPTPHTAAGRGGPPPIHAPYGNMPPAQQSPSMLPPQNAPYGGPGPRPGSRAGAGGPGGPRHDSMGPGARHQSPGPRQSSQPTPQPQGVSLNDRPPTAPPAQQVRPSPASPAPSGKAPSIASQASSQKPPRAPSDHPDGKTVGGGPATFDEMGVPKHKDDKDCVSVFPLNGLGQTQLDNLLLTRQTTDCHVKNRTLQ
ncbi:hypothetical protein N0V82_007238 [Gnomoniopsis sp. IMI 355080]|nr:hypothetical protein N0V82_007238 [Gnomoniopsis sp. IMI 355080]